MILQLELHIWSWLFLQVWCFAVCVKASPCSCGGAWLDISSEFHQPRRAPSCCRAAGPHSCGAGAGRPSLPPRPRALLLPSQHGPHRPHQPPQPHNTHQLQAISIPVCKLLRDCSPLAAPRTRLVHSSTVRCSATRLSDSFRLARPTLASRR